MLCRDVAVLCCDLHHDGGVAGAGAAWLNSQLSSVMLVSIEAAVEFWLALSWSPQAQWLRYSDPSGCLLVGPPTASHAIIAVAQLCVTALHIENTHRC